MNEEEEEEAGSVCLSIYLSPLLFKSAPSSPVHYRSLSTALAKKCVGKVELV